MYVVKQPSGSVRGVSPLTYLLGEERIFGRLIHTTQSSIERSLLLGALTSMKVDVYLLRITACDDRRLYRIQRSCELYNGSGKIEKAVCR